MRAHATSSTLLRAARRQGIGDSAFVGQSQQYPFSAVVFTSWDYHLTDAGAARNLRNTIRNQLGEMLSDAALADVRLSRSQRVGGLLLKARRKLPLLFLFP